MLSSTLGEAGLNERTCREWFQRFKSGDFDVEDQHGGRKKKIFEDSELEALLAEDSCQTQEELADSLGVIKQAISKRLKTIEMIQKQEKSWRMSRQASTPMATPNIHSAKVRFCIWWDQLRVVVCGVL